MKTVCCVLGFASALVANAAWEPGEPVVAYWGGPGYWTNAEKLDDRWLQQLKDGGFNTVWARTPEELGNAARYGMRVIYTCSTPRPSGSRLIWTIPYRRLHLRSASTA